MSVAIPIPLLQNLPDVNVSLGVGVDEYALCWDNDTAKFVLRAPAAAPDLSGYALLAGRAGGQTLYGGTAANDDITIHGTSDATRTTSYVILQPTAGNVGIGTTAPAWDLEIKNGNAYTIAGITNTLAAGRAIFDIRNDTADFGQLQTYGSAYSVVGLRKHSAFSAKNSLVFGTDSGVANGGTNAIYFLTGGYEFTTQIRVTINSTGNVGINDTAPAEKLDVTGNANVTGVYKVDDVQVLSNRVIDARADDAANSGDATTDGLIDALRDAMIAHGLIAAA